MVAAGGGHAVHHVHGRIFDLYPGILRHVDVLIYNGDVDACVPYNRADWVDALVKQQNFTETQAWSRGCSAQCRRATSRSTTGSHSLSFLTIKESGHMAPRYQPARSFAFFSRWLAGDPF